MARLPFTPLKISIFSEQHVAQSFHFSLKILIAASARVFFGARTRSATDCLTAAHFEGFLESADLYSG